MYKRWLFPLLAVTLGTFALLPFLHRSEAGLSTEEIGKCRVQAKLFFDGLEHLFISRLVMSKLNDSTYYVRAYSRLGLPYDGAVMRVLEPYDEAKYANKKYIENQ